MFYMGVKIVSNRHFKNYRRIRSSLCKPGAWSRRNSICIRLVRSTKFASSRSRSLKQIRETGDIHLPQSDPV